MRDNIYYHKPVIESNVGPSNVWTTVEDMSRWVLNFEKPRVGNPAVIAAFNKPSLFDDGKRVFIRIIDGDTIFHAKGQNIWKHKGVTIFSHGGHTAAFRTFTGRFPDHNLSIIQLSNDEHNERLGGRWDIADYYIKNLLVEKEIANSPVQSITTVPTPTENYNVDLNEFTGNYYNNELDTKYHLEVKSNQLIMKHKRLYDITLKRIGENTFSGSGSNTFGFELNFMRNGTGVIIGFTISNWGARNVKFEKQN